VPICFVEAVDEGFVRDGMNIAVVAFGGGLTWAAGVLRWGPGSVGRENGR
jgi:3-oxoacyl-[acyl-carrier-protein] synthase-3